MRVLFKFFTKEQKKNDFFKTNLMIYELLLILKEILPVNENQFKNKK